MRKWLAERCLEMIRQRCTWGGCRQHGGSYRNRGEPAQQSEESSHSTVLGPCDKARDKTYANGEDQE